MSIAIQVTTDQVIAIAAGVVALAALVVAVWEGVMARRHNRLSVMPHVSLRHHLYGSHGNFGISASNDGLGPALVTHCVLEVDGEAMNEEGDNGWEAAITTLGLRECKLAYATVAPKGVIRTGDMVWLLSTPATKETEDHIAKIEKIEKIEGAFRRLNVRMSYESIYGDKSVATYRE